MNGRKVHIWSNVDASMRYVFVKQEIFLSKKKRELSIICDETSRVRIVNELLSIVPFTHRI